jgi:hypothetical protein
LELPLVPVSALFRLSGTGGLPLFTVIFLFNNQLKFSRTEPLLLDFILECSGQFLFLAFLKNYICNMRKIYAIVFLQLIFLLSSCSSPNFKVLESSSQTGIVMEGRYWKGFFTSHGSFEIRLTNNSNQDYNNCVVILDSKYRHSLDGLHTREIGMIKDSVFHKGEQVTIYFSDYDSNLIFFEGAEEGYLPETIGLKCNECEGVWKLR